MNKRRFTEISPGGLVTKRPRVESPREDLHFLKLNQPSQNHLQWIQVTEAIKNYSRIESQSEELFQRKSRLREALFTVVKDVFPNCGLFIVGSSLNGCGSNTSDMDLCLMVSQKQIDQRQEATSILSVLRKAFRKCSFLQEMKLIRAKVPILKFKDKFSSIECDLNINNSVGIRNTHLLLSYSELDTRVPALVQFIKFWAKCQNINDASQGSISSYSLVLMVLHYLQYGCSPAVLPSLQLMYPGKFDPTQDIRGIRLDDKLPPYLSPNHQALGELFYGFLEYFANQFDFNCDAISIRLGKKLRKDVVMYQNTARNPPGQWKYLSIEEPFDLSNTARSVFDANIFARIHRVIRNSWHILRTTRNADRILLEPV